MLFLGHFSFNEMEEEPRHGHFHCLVDAKTPSKAVKAFRELIIQSREKILSKSIDIYLDTIIKIDTLPPSGVVTYFTSRRGEDIGGISISLPNKDVGKCRSLTWYSDNIPEEDIEKGSSLWEPFLIFRDIPDPMEFVKDGKEKKKKERKSKVKEQGAPAQGKK